MASSFVTTNESVTGGMTPPLVLQKHTQHFRQTMVNWRLKKSNAWRMTTHGLIARARLFRKAEIERTRPIHCTRKVGTVPV
jgi:hypothetical protein